jgi:hypothetical protein
MKHIAALLSNHTPCLGEQTNVVSTIDQPQSEPLGVQGRIARDIGLDFLKVS